VALIFDWEASLIHLAPNSLDPRALILPTGRLLSEGQFCHDMEEPFTIRRLFTSVIGDTHV
jgi:hypothetical protein